MKYMGSKNRFAKELLPIILKDRTLKQWYVEPFAGGMNLIDKVGGNRLANDSNKYLIGLWKALINGYKPPSFLTKKEYLDIKDNKSNYPIELVGWAGFLCSYSGKYFGGYAGKIIRKENGKLRNYQNEAHTVINKQVLNLLDVEFIHSSYQDLEIPANSLIYCDPPYEGTTKYKDDFNHLDFWEWCRTKTKEEHQVFISEYNAPDDFKCIWEKETKSRLSANGKIGGTKASTEKIFVYCC